MCTRASRGKHGKLNSLAACICILKTGEEFEYMCGPNTKLTSVFKRHAFFRGWKVTSLRFLCDGERVDDGHKRCSQWRAEHMEYNDWDVYIDCMMEQIGGRYFLF